MLPLSQSWPVRCRKCGHTAVINAPLADLAAKRLRCQCCNHRQPFAPESVVRAPRRPNGRKAREERRAAHFGKSLDAPDPLLNDRLDDVAWAG
ncbi:hypothetical protein [Bradyrhizobium cenepequi]